MPGIVLYCLDCVDGVVEAKSSAKQGQEITDVFSRAIAAIFLEQHATPPTTQKKCSSNFHIDAAGLRAPKQFQLLMSIDHYEQFYRCSYVHHGPRLVLVWFVAVVVALLPSSCSFFSLSNLPRWFHHTMES